MRQEQEVPKDALQRIEACLYAAGRPIDIATLTRVAGLSSRRITRKLVAELAQRYRRSGSALEIAELPGSRFVMRVRASYSEYARRVARDLVLSRGAIRTLLYIAYKYAQAGQPVKRALITRVVGPSAYRHIERLRLYGLIVTKRHGRTLEIAPSPRFYDLFSLDPQKPLLPQLRRLFTKAGITPPSRAPSEAGASSSQSKT